MMATEVIVAILGLAGVTFTAFLGYRSVLVQRRMTDQARQEMSLQADALDFVGLFHEWGTLERELSGLMASTEVDRFMVLNAWNGLSTPRWTTAIYQRREGPEEPVSYYHVELDQDYVDRLRLAVSRGSHYIKVAELPDCLIRRVYEAEGVRSSFWCHVRSRAAANNPSLYSVTYVSFATHDGDLSQNTMTRCQLVADRLRGMADGLENGRNPR